MIGNSSTIKAGSSSAEIWCLISYDDTLDDTYMTVVAEATLGEKLLKTKQRIKLVGNREIETDFYWGMSSKIEVNRIINELTLEKTSKVEKQLRFICNRNRPFVIYDQIYGVCIVTEKTSGFVQNVDRYVIMIDSKKYILLTTRLLQKGDIEWNLNFKNGVNSYKIVERIDTDFDPNNPKEK